MVHIMRIDEMAIKKQIFSEFDEIDRFNDEYLKVKKDDKYNLVDFNGNLLSDIWFDDIEERKDHTFDVKFRDDANNVHSGNFDTNETPVTKTTFKSSMNIPVLNPVFDEIDINDIVVLYEPYTIEEADTDESVKIVAIVTYKGRQYQLGEDGELYGFDNKMYFTEEGADWTQRYTKKQILKGITDKKSTVENFLKKYYFDFIKMVENVKDVLNSEIKSSNNEISEISYELMDDWGDIAYFIENNEPILNFYLDFKNEDFYKKRSLPDDFNIGDWSVHFEYAYVYRGDDSEFNSPHIIITYKEYDGNHIMPLNANIEGEIENVLKKAIKNYSITTI